MMWSFAAILLVVLFLHQGESITRWSLNTSDESEADEGVEGDLLDIEIKKRSKTGQSYDFNQKECGKYPALKPRYVSNGIKARKEDIPSFAALSIFKVVNGENVKLKCGGVLIDDDLVLTAAECIDRAKEVLVTVTTHDTKVAQDFGEPVYKGKAACIPTSFVPDKLPALYNFGVVKLIKKAPMSDRTQTACLLSTEVSIDQDMIVASSGHVAEDKPADGLYYLPVRKEFCQKHSHKSLMCVASSETSRPGTACKGDLGSPVLVGQDGRMAVAGLVNYGEGGCLKWKQQFYTTSMYELRSDLIDLMNNCN